MKLKSIIAVVAITLASSALAAKKLPGHYATKVISLNCKNNASVIEYNKELIHLHIVKINGKPGTRKLCYKTFPNKKKMKLRYVELGRVIMPGPVEITANAFNY